MTSMKNLYLNIGDLPLHPLAVHFAVALFPVALVALILTISWKRLRDRYLTAAVVAVFLTLPLVFVAQQSGESLADVLYEPQPHSEYGEMLMPLALVTAAFAAGLWLSIRKNWNKIFSQIIAFTTISLSVASLAMTFVVGHSGAEAVWGGKVITDVQVDSLPTEDPTGPSTNSEAVASGISVQEVASHNGPGDCWVVIDGSVYALDGYMSKHPGGKAVLTALCGKDGTAAFSNQHARQALPNSELATLFVGTLATSGAVDNSGGSDTQNGASPAKSNSYTAEQIASHSTANDCWTLIDTTVYDLSSYANEHPGGAGNITALCGVDATSAFAGQHGFTGVPANVLAPMAIGSLDGASTLPSTKVTYGEGEDEEGDEDRD